jgi:crossover junction endodeoxyribonuclease RuvC
MRVLGIDPGTAATGYGVVEEREGSLHAVRFGAITSPASLPFAQRLLRIYRDLRTLLTASAPTAQPSGGVFEKCPKRPRLGREVSRRCPGEAEILIHEYWPESSRP